MLSQIQNIKNEAIAQIMDAKSVRELEEIRVAYLGRSGKLSLLIKNVKNFDPEERKQAGIIINESKNIIQKTLAEKKNSFQQSARSWFDPTISGIKIKRGHLHPITFAINEIAKIFEQLGFVRVRYPEVEWDWFSFEALNMPNDHPARDEWETFFVDTKPHPKYGKMVLTPHTSSGQIREMQRVKIPPIRMINIAKCYRRQADASHFPMFHQFEGLVVDKEISIVHLKGVIDFFVKNFFGPKRKTRFRPYHFQFTEPSFEVDINCDVCEGLGCKVCKKGWHELGGAGMVHPVVLKNGGVNPSKFTGFAFGFGVERVFMMKSGLKIPDLRLIYSSDLRFLKQF